MTNGGGWGWIPSTAFCPMHIFVCPDITVLAALSRRKALDEPESYTPLQPKTPLTGSSLLWGAHLMRGPYRGCLPGFSFTDLFPTSTLPRAFFSSLINLQDGNFPYDIPSLPQHFQLRSAPAQVWINLGTYVYNSVISCIRSKACLLIHASADTCNAVYRGNLSDEWTGPITLGELPD